HHAIVMNVIFLLKARIRRSNESKAGVVLRITHDNHHVLSSSPAPLQSLADEFRSDALPLKLPHYSHRSQSDAAEGGRCIGNGDAGEENVANHYASRDGD